MMLVPTLERMVGELVAQDFWANHARCQVDLDRQNEGDLSFFAAVHRHWDESLRQESFFDRLKRKGLVK